MRYNLNAKVIKQGLCVGCGACVALDTSNTSIMQDTLNGPVPLFSNNTELPNYIEDACPGLGINYPKLYMHHYGHYPENWLLGHINKSRTGHTSNLAIHNVGASGGVMTQTLIYLLETKKIDAIILAKQGVPSAEKASAVIVNTKEEIIAGAQSVYIPVSMLDILKKLKPNKTYAITCLPEQSAALRIMQKNNFSPAKQIKYIIGPYTGTALYPNAINCFLRSKGIRKDDHITSLKWRAGKWPGYLEIKTSSGKIIQTPKVYYNFLIPFFITQTSLQSMDFSNEFADIAVGDAWSPEFEKQQKGHSIVVTRTPESEEIIEEMCKNGLLDLTEIDPLSSSDMHGHMLDFKKRGGWLRNQWRRKTGRNAPNYGYRPANIPIERIIIEIIISLLFAIGKTKLSRLIISHIPESIVGPIFNKLRLSWKKLSKPTKRKGLAKFEVKILQ